MSHQSNISVGAVVRRERQRLGLSQVGLAAAAGTSVGTVSLAERGGFLSRETAEKFAAVLGVAADVLLGGGS